MMCPVRSLCCLGALIGATAAPATQLALPSTAQQAATLSETLGSQRLPISAYDNGHMQTVWAEGAIRTDAWQMAHGGMTSLQILAPLRDQLVQAGYEVRFECADLDCGGFDFRYALEVLPAPEMHVDLGDYRYLLAQRDTAEAEDFVTLLVSRSAERGFVQITTVGAAAAVIPQVVTATKSPDPVAQLTPVTNVDLGAASLPVQLQETGRAVLADLSFQTGSSKLAEGGADSLQALAAFLVAEPERSVVLVGHTDAEGALDSNINLSRQRADAVRAHLVSTLGIAPERVRAEGVGYLAPLTTNETAEGRSANRRVEVILK